MFDIPFQTFYQGQEVSFIEVLVSMCCPNPQIFNLFGVCVCVCVTWIDAEATWPAWSKSRDTMWEKRLALVFIEVELLPKASRMV